MDLWGSIKGLENCIYVLLSRGGGNVLRICEGHTKLARDGTWTHRRPPSWLDHTNKMQQQLEIKNHLRGTWKQEKNCWRCVMIKHVVCSEHYHANLPPSHFRSLWYIEISTLKCTIHVHFPSTICSQMRTFYEIDSIREYIILNCYFKLNLMLIITDTFTIIYVQYFMWWNFLMLEVLFNPNLDGYKRVRSRAAGSSIWLPGGQ